MSAPIVFLDTETTHLEPDLREIWEVGMVKRDLDGDTELQFFVEVDLAYADERSLEVGGFYQRSPQGRVMRGLDPNGRLLSKAKMVELVELWTRDQAHIVGANPSFDTETLNRDMRFCSVGPDWHHHLIDIESLVAGYLRNNQRRAYLRLLEMQDMSDRTDEYRVEQRVVSGEIAEIGNAISLPYRLTALTTAMGVDLPAVRARHTALGDARWVRNLWDAVNR